MVVARARFVREFALQIKGAFAMSFREECHHLMVVRSRADLSPGPFRLEGVLFDQVLLRVHFYRDANLLVVSFRRVGLSCVVEGRYYVCNVVLRELRAFRHLIVTFLRVVGVDRVVGDIVLVR